jgi:hypothetical protein
VAGRHGLQTASAHRFNRGATIAEIGSNAVTPARNRWIAAALSLGAPAAFSRNLTHFRRHRPTPRRLRETPQVNFRNLTPSDPPLCVAAR